YAMESRFDSLTFELKKLEGTLESEQGKNSIKDALNAVAAYEKAVKSLVTQDRSDLPSQDEIADRLFNEIRSLGDTAEILVSLLPLEKQNAAKERAEEIQAV